MESRVGLTLKTSLKTEFSLHFLMKTFSSSFHACINYGFRIPCVTAVQCKVYQSISIKHLIFADIQ